MSARKPQPKFGMTPEYLHSLEHQLEISTEGKIAANDRVIQVGPSGLDVGWAGTPYDNEIRLYQDPERNPQYTGYEGKSNGWMVYVNDGDRKFMEWFKQRTTPSATHGCFSRGDSITEWVRAYRAASTPPRRITCNGREVKRPGIYHNLSDHHFAFGV